ncbi:MAG: peptide chain release factor N(5)-glutamine methyltransferase [Bacteroidia bacterium]|nr:peptide chain release factor N(5)-glutamine methyltransferase [Bacteroidia bacterium]
MKIAAFSEKCKNELAEVYDSAEVNALVKLLLQERLKLSFSELRFQEDRELPDEQLSVLEKDLVRLKTGEPVQHVLGYTWFHDLKILVSGDVLIPRPETEELVSFIQDYSLPEEANLLDICCGSGCIALALKHHFTSAKVFAADVSDVALELAAENSRVLSLPLNIFKWNVLEENCPESDLPLFEVIVSNPPYVRMEEINEMHPNVVKFEPHLALFVPDDEPLLFYRIIADFSSQQLKKGGRLWFEINRAHGEEVAEMLEQKGYSDVRIYHDMSGNDRFVSAVNW